MPTGPQGPPPPQNTFSSPSVRYTQPVVTAAPKVVYSSKPVINKPSKKAAGSEVKVVESTGATKRTAPESVASSSSTNVAANVAAQSGSSATVNDSGQPVVKKDKKNKQVKEKRFVRTAANDVWEDQSLADWDPSKDKRTAMLEL